MATAARLPLDALPKLPVLGRAPDATEFLEHLLASVGDETEFLASLGTLADWYGASTMALNEFNHRTRSGRLLPVRGFGPSLMRAYLERYAACNVWLLDADRKLRTGDLGVSHLLYPDSLLVNTEFYSDFVRPQGVFHSMGAVIVCQDGRTITTPMLREESAGNFTDDEQLVLRSLAPFLEQAFRLHTRLVTAESYGAATRSLLDSLPTAVFLLDADGNVVGLNAAADALAREQDGLTIAHGKLVFASRRAGATVSLLLQGLAARTDDSEYSPGRVFRVDRLSGRQAYVADFVSLARMPASLCGPAAAAALLVANPDDATNCDAELIRHLFGLSETEARLASLLASGHDLADSTAELEVTVSTGKTLLQRIFAKTGVNRQAELIRLVLTSLSSIRRNERSQQVGHR
jgi:DNA-binding CsgD family transcriptional regulator